MPCSATPGSIATSPASAALKTSADIAPAVLFLCSDGARWINGTNIAVDGGLEASINAEVLGF